METQKQQEQEKNYTRKEITENRKRQEQLVVDHRLKTSSALEKKKKNFPHQPKPCNQPRRFPLMALRSAVRREEVSGTTTLPLSRCLKGLATGIG